MKNKNPTKQSLRKFPLEILINYWKQYIKHMICNITAIFEMIEDPDIWSVSDKSDKNPPRNHEYSNRKRQDYVCWKE